MIDHLIRFNSEAEAIEALPQFYAEDWDRSICLPNVKVWKPAEDVVSADVDGNELRTHIYQPYWYIIISKPERDLSLSCILVTDREAALAGQPFVRFTLIPWDQMNSYRMEPTFAGSNYPFGNAE